MTMAGVEVVVIGGRNETVEAADGKMKRSWNTMR